MRTSFHHQSEAQPPNGPLTAVTSPDTPSAAQQASPVSNVSHMKVHAAGTRRVSAAGLAPPSGEIVTQIQIGGSQDGFAGSNPTCPATQSVSASATQAWRSDERLISRNHRARWRHRKVQRCTVGYRRGLAGRRGSGTTPHGSGPLSAPDDSAAGSEYQCTGGARLRDSCSASMAALA